MQQKLDLILRSAPKGRVSKDAPMQMQLFRKLRAEEGPSVPLFPSPSPAGLRRQGEKMNDQPHAQREFPPGSLGPQGGARPP